MSIIFTRGQYNIKNSKCWIFSPVTYIDFDACVNFSLFGNSPMHSYSPWHCVLYLQYLVLHDTSSPGRLAVEGGVLIGPRCHFFHFELSWNCGPRHHMKLILTDPSTTQTLCDKNTVYSREALCNRDDYISRQY